MGHPFPKFNSIKSRLLEAIFQKCGKQEKEFLDETIEKWRGEQEQVDDICIIGVRI
jgi:hypothetical protein